MKHIYLNLQSDWLPAGLGGKKKADQPEEGESGRCQPLSLISRVRIPSPSFLLQHHEKGFQSHLKESQADGVLNRVETLNNRQFNYAKKKEGGNPALTSNHTQHHQVGSSNHLHRSINFPQIPEEQASRLFFIYKAPPKLSATTTPPQQKSFDEPASWGLKMRYPCRRSLAHFREGF